MREAFRAEVAGITDLVEAAALADDVRDSVVWCLRQFPALYDQFCQTYERRFSEETLRLEQVVLGKLAESCRSSALRGAFLNRLRLMNECFGLPGLGFRPPLALSSRSRKAG
jgi:hypothetical protein